MADIQIDRSQYQFSDPLPLQMLMAYNEHEGSGAPCKLCKSQPEMQGRRVHFHGSDVGGCPRKTYFTMVEGKPATKEFGAKAAFLQDGHLHEAMMLGALSTKFEIYAPKNDAELRFSIPMLDDETKVQRFVAEGEPQPLGEGVRTFLLIGHIDGALTVPDVPYPILLECKSVKDYKWDLVKAGKISQEWYGQMQSYMWMMGSKHAYLLVKNRTTSEMMLPIRIDFDLEWVTRKVKMMIQIYKHVNVRKEIPKPSSRKKTESECKFCSYVDRCYT